MGLRAAWGAFQTLGADRALQFGQLSGLRVGSDRQDSGVPAAYAPERVSMQGRSSRHNRSSSKYAGNEVRSDVGRRCELRERRIELEQDVAQLRKRLVKEENVHRALERAFNRPIGALPRLPQYLPPKTRRLLAEVAVLEEEVVRLEDRVISLQEDLHDEVVFASMFTNQQKAEAAASLQPKGLFSVGDKRAAPAKKDVLIARLLEVPEKKKGLQLQKASAANELPAASHAKARATAQNKNMHKSQVLNANGSAKGVREKYFGCNNRQLSVIQEEEREKENLQQQQKKVKLAESWPNSLKLEAGTKEEPAKETAPALKKVEVPAAPKVLRPQEKPKFGPNKLSEEMVKCLMGIYGMMTRLYSLSDSDASSVVSRSTFSSFSSQSNGTKSTASTKTPSEFSFDLDRCDPYGVCQDYPSRDIGPYRHFQNIAADSFDYSRIPSSASLFRRLRVLIGKLATVDLHDMSQQQKLAFWINIYNACMMHAFLEYGIPCGPHQVVGLMRKATLNVGGYSLNALAIEHFILRLPSHSKHAFVKITSKDKAHIQSTLGLDWPEPLVSFALCCGSKSSPAVRVYTAADVENELEVAKKEYLQAAVGVNSKGKVLIPKLLDWNMRDFAKDRESLLDWISDQLPSQLQSTIQECIRKSNGVISSALQVMPYDFNFRYLLTV